MVCVDGQLTEDIDLNDNEESREEKDISDSQPSV